MENPPKKNQAERETISKTRYLNPLRVGIAGAGLMGKWHARAAENAGGKIVCIADPDEKRSAGLAKDYSSAQIFTDAAELLDQKSLDVLHICTPTPSHRQLADIAVNAGVNLFIEKPLAPTAALTASLYESAAKKNVKICPAHQLAFQEGVQKAKKLLPRIGQILHLRATICSAGGEGLDAGQIDTIAADILPHPLSLFQSILNGCLPEENWEVLRPRAGDMRVFGQVRETSLSIFISMNARPTVNSFEIFGEMGTIHLDLFHGFAILERGKVSRARKILRPFDLAVKGFSVAALNLARRTIRSEPAYPGLRRLVKDFYQSIREEREPPISPAQAINVALVRDYITRRIGDGKLEKNIIMKK